MAQGKQNCWEYMDCGREPGGPACESKGVCSASMEVVLDGTHDGVNGGRACWVAAGVLSGGPKEGTFVPSSLCVFCSFYDHVIKEEGSSFTFSPTLIATLSPVDARGCVRCAGSTSA